LADDLKIVPDVDMVELRLSRLKPEDCDLWNAKEEIAATSNCGINGAIQAYIRTRGGPPTEKEIEDYREEKLAEERKKWDEDFVGWGEEYGYKK
jgi:hypothetical protein